MRKKNLTDLKGFSQGILMFIPYTLLMAQTISPRHTFNYDKLCPILPLRYTGRIFLVAYIDPGLYDFQVFGYKSSNLVYNTGENPGGFFGRGNYIIGSAGLFKIIWALIMKFSGNLTKINILGIRNPVELYREVCSKLLYYKENIR
jgi:hypothetical protein